jgi:transposase-like protein
MEQRTTAEASPSTVTWETLEAWTRGRIQAFIQALLEEEVTMVLGRWKSERRQAVDAGPGYRNGYGKPRRLSLTSGTITVRRPRARATLRPALDE